MSFLDVIIPVFQNSDGGKGGWQIWSSFVLSIFGAASLTAAFWPGFWQVFKTKDTKFLPLGLFSCHLLVGLLMTLGSILSIAGYDSDKGVPVAVLLRSIVFTYLNGFLLITTGYQVGLTIYNKWKAGELKFTDESDQKKESGSFFNTKQSPK